MYGWPLLKTRALKERSEQDGCSAFPVFLRSKKASPAALKILSLAAVFTFGPEQGLKVMQASDSEKHFVIYTRSCVVPDCGPWHPSVLPHVSTTPPISCSKYPAYSHTERNRIFIDTSAMKETINGTTARPPIMCCYHTLYRAPDADNDTTLSDTCVPVGNNTVIKFEFIQLVCSDADGEPVYKNYHAFVIRKPAVEERCARSLGQRRTEGASGGRFVKTAPKRGKLAYSVMLLGADSLSRNNMKRSHANTVRSATNLRGTSVSFLSIGVTTSGSIQSALGRLRATQCSRQRRVFSTAPSPSWEKF
ncbi:uncharacterized protein LOC142767314 [Rhipicephalus microplus]|uniref:uncharacterized protein LOC142767314 n=1 Tax=Rhipicephalus microplus TaxID=6941 RepID=UPI003F6CEB30